MSKSKIEEMARARADLLSEHPIDSLRYAMLDKHKKIRVDFLAGARAVLEEAKKKAEHCHMCGLAVNINDLEALFKEEDHEQR